MVPKGIHSNPILYENRCLPVAFCIGKMLYEASYQGEAAVKKLLYDLRGLSQKATATKKHKNAIGQKIWDETPIVLIGNDMIHCK